MNTEDNLRKEKPILIKLKEVYEGWELSVKIRNEARYAAKVFFKQKEKELRDAKRVIYLTTKAWNEARINSKKAKNKWKSYVSSRRQWAKHNLGKVFNNMEKVE
jgi:hypothetical protein